MHHNTFEALSIAIRRNSLKLATKVLQQPGASIIDDDWADYTLLIQALQRGRKQIVRLLLEHGCRVNRDTKTHFYCTPLYYAVRLGDIDIVSLLLEKGALVSKTDFNKETALDLAMKRNHCGIIKMLFSKYFSVVNKRYSKGNCTQSQLYVAYYIAYLTGNKRAMNSFQKMKIFTKNLPLHYSQNENELLQYAIQKMLVELVQVLIMCGADITTRNAEGMTPLHLAFRSHMDNSTNIEFSDKFKKQKILDLILSAHTERTENCVDREGLSHFHIACSRNNVNVIKKFLQSGVDVNSKVSLAATLFPGYTPLHLAVYFAHYKIVQVLLQYEADVNAVNGEGFTALHMAALDHKENLFYNRSIVDLILSAHDEKSENSINKDGISHFHIACTRYDKNIVRGFLERKVNVNSTVSSNSDIFPGYTPLHCAVENFSADIVELLLQHQADINAINAQGLTALHIAFILSDRCSLKATTNLIIGMMLSSNNGKSFNSINKDGLSHLHIACTMNKPNVVESLLRSGADINGKISLTSKVLPGFTPLHCAARYNRKDIVNILLKYNADVNAIDSKQKRPLEIACHLNHIRICDLVNSEVYAHKYNTVPEQPFGDCAYSAGWVNNRQDQMDIIWSLIKYQYDDNFKEKFSKKLFKNYEKFYDMDETYRVLRSENLDIVDHVAKIVHIEFLIRRNEIVKIFFTHDNSKIRDDKGYSMLHILASSTYNDDGLDRTAEFLLNKGICSVNDRTNTGLTSLHLAVINGDYRRSLIKLLLKHKADVNCFETENHWTPLHFAGKYYDKDPEQFEKVISTLVDKGANVNFKDKNGQTPLYRCSSYYTNFEPWSRC